MARSVCLALVSLLGVAAAHSHRIKRVPVGPREAAPTPSAAILNWTNAEIGAINPNKQRYCLGVGGEQGVAVPPPSTFNPANLNTDQWLQVIQSFGGKYAVFVTMHCSGFALWPTNLTFFNYTYSIANSPLMNGKANLVDMFVQSAKKHNINYGFYYSLNENYYLNVGDGHIWGGGLAPGQVNVSQQTYVDIAVAQMAEIWSAYDHQLFEVWFDGGDDLPGIDQNLQKYQPQAVYFQGSATYNNIRWVGTEGGEPGYPVWSTCNGEAGAGERDGRVFMPAESDTTLQQGDQWFWSPFTGLRPLSDMIKVYHQTVGQNSNLLLDVAPDNTGVVPAAAVALYAQFGQWIQNCYGPGKELGKTSGTTNSLVLTLATPGSTDRVVLQEDQTNGEQVWAYSLELQSAGRWQTVGTGTAVGHKRIHLLGQAHANVQAVRVNATQLAPGFATVAWANLAAYSACPSG